MIPAYRSEAKKLSISLDMKIPSSYSKLLNLFSEMERSSHAENWILTVKATYYTTQLSNKHGLSISKAAQIECLIKLNTLAKTTDPASLRHYFLPNFDINILKQFLVEWDPFRPQCEGFLSVMALKNMADKVDLPLRFDTFNAIVRIYISSAGFFYRKLYKMNPTSSSLCFTLRCFEAVTSLIGNCVNTENVCPYYKHLNEEVMINILKVVKRLKDMKLGTLAFWEGVVASHIISLRTLMRHMYIVAQESSPILAPFFHEQGGTKLLLRWLVKTSKSNQTVLPWDIHFTIFIVLLTLVKAGHAEALCKNYTVDILLNYAHVHHFRLVIQTSQTDIQIMMMITSILNYIVASSTDAWKEIVHKNGIEILDAFICAYEPTKSKVRALLHILKDKLISWKTDSTPYLPGTCYDERYKETKKKYPISDLVTELKVKCFMTYPPQRHRLTQVNGRKRKVRHPSHGVGLAKRRRIQIEARNQPEVSAFPYNLLEQAQALIREMAARIERERGNLGKTINLHR